MTQEQYQQIAHKLPVDPGIYKYYDAGGILIYVGKAKCLKKRIASYFTKNQNSFKTIELVQKIDRIEFTIVDSEQDALLLENSLIKQYKPRYNILLKDDKGYPYLVIKNERFPRVFLTWKKYNDGSTYLGPFTSKGTIREVLSFVKQFIPLRTCKLNLSKENIEKNKFKTCLEYHLGNCLAPCVGLQTEEAYLESLDQLKNMLKGNMNQLMTHLKKEMQAHAEALDFEKAAQLKYKMDLLLTYQEKSVVVGKHFSNLDVFSIIKDGKLAYVNYLMVQNGSIIQTHTVPLEGKLDEPEDELLCFAIERLRSDFNSLSTEIIVPYPIEYFDKNITITVPKLGDKKKLLDLSIKNVTYFSRELQLKKILQLDGKTGSEKKLVLTELQSYLHLQETPTHIECFDNSNFQGSFPVSAMVCFKDGVPSKKDYRHFNVKTVEGINDFATMKEVVYRRYKRVQEAGDPMPQLIVIDGGKGQLSAALESIEALGLTGSTTLVGLAKNEEEIFFAGDSQSLKLPWDSDSLKLLRGIRDEVHRFGITFHRNKRSKGTFTTALENIEGIGPATREILLNHFKSVNNIKKASYKDLADVVGAKKAETLVHHFTTTA
ncbi:MAG: excinuclease ABC subunit UvrC [Bacteroidetes bacterium]|jgi:excinuclease ABC subunit C|nr:excinuclease ABC subunit UvrC [Bacteroidota bacterium]